MKILFTLPEYGPNIGGGIATFYRHLLPELVQRGHSVEVLVAGVHGQPQSNGQVHGVTVRYLKSESVSGHVDNFNAYGAVPDLQRHLATAWAAWHEARGGDGFDVVETTDYGMLFVPWTVNDDRPPLVVQMHGSHGQLKLHDPIQGGELGGRLAFMLEAGLLPRADELQSDGLPNAQEWSSLLRAAVEYIPPGWKPCDLPPCGSDGAAAGIEGLVVGRIQCWKGPEILCKALRLLGESAPSISWLGGDKPFRQGTNSMSAYLAEQFPDVWGRKVRPLETRPTAETAALQAAARFIVVPSTWDVFNLSAVEGMGLGRVVVCSQGAGAAQLIRDGENGFSFPASDAAVLAEKLRQVKAMTDAERERMGQVARHTVQEELNPGRIAEKRIERFHRLTREGRKKVTASPEWQHVAGPDQASVLPTAFLDRLPLKRITRYTIKRIFDRILRKAR